MEGHIDSLLHEERHFPPSPEFVANAVAGPELYEQAEADRLEFWAEQARRLHWDTPFSTVLDWSTPPFAKWFEDGELNVAYNCLDRHVEAGLGNRVAFYWEGEPGDSRVVTYAELTNEVKQAANMFRRLGVRPGDRVALFMPMIPEAIVAMLAAARIGAMHSVCFGGFSADSFRVRVDDCEAKLVVTADGGWRKGKVIPLKPLVDTALGPRFTEWEQETVQKVLVVRRCKNPVSFEPERDRWWHDEMAISSLDHKAQPFPAENPLFVLYTSGTTGKPKGILHTSGGYLTQVAYTHRAVFDLHPESDVYWCTADIGWITGHSYIVYGPLANGATQVLYEGTPDSPHPGRWWEIIEKYGVTIFYTAPTAIRNAMRLGRTIPQQFDLSSLRLLGSVGEPINPEAWVWYRQVIGGGRAPIVDTWWQTETGAIMISPLPGVTTTKPGSAQRPLPGISISVLDDDGKPVENGSGGLLSITEPWPSMLRGLWREPKRYKKVYWKKFKDKYFAGDGAHLDEDGDIWLLGRVDDVINVSGHRLSTAEIESALIAHPMTAEAGVVGAPDEVTGDCIVAFVVIKDRQVEAAESTDIEAELRAYVAQQIGPIARPKSVIIVDELPKTRSGKIMRRLLRDVVQGRGIGETSTLANAHIIRDIAERVPASF